MIDLKNIIKQSKRTIQDEEEVERDNSHISLQLYLLPCSVIAQLLLLKYLKLLPHKD